MRALVFERNLTRFAASRVASTVRGSGGGVKVSALRLVDTEEPRLPGPGWNLVRPLLSGICGSDLSTVDGRSSRYFEDFVSFPFVPGHEIVGTVAESSGVLATGTRVVVESVISCVPRGIAPTCGACAEGRVGNCERVAFGHMAPGLQIGFCEDTGGGWSTAGVLAHDVQVHAVPDTMTDEEAVMVEPTACAVHAVLSSKIRPGATVAVLGAGTLGLVTIAALRQLCEPGSLFVGAKHPHQRRLASRLGADLAVAPDHLPRAVRRASRSLAVTETGDQLTGGADVVIDCVGSADSITEALAIVRPRGRLVLLGMPGPVRVDLASLWHREVELAGTYAYGTENVGGITQRTFEVAMGVVVGARLGTLVSARYPIDRYEEAITHAGAAGRRNAVKIVFDFRTGRRSTTTGTRDHRGVTS